MIGIYKITNVINEKVYVGESLDIKKRWYSHRWHLRNRKYDSHFQKSWNKYGEESFEFSILKECLLEELQYWEEYYINLYESYKPENGYNKDRFSNGSKCRSEKTVNKMKEKRALQVFSEETKRKISESHKGKKHSKEHIEKIRVKSVGRKHSEETRNKMREKRAKQVFSDETKRKISESRKGKKASTETKQKFSEKRKGEDNSNSKLTWEQIREIRRKYVPRKYTQVMLSREYSVGVKCIQDIILRIHWKQEERVGEQ